MFVVTLKEVDVFGLKIGAGMSIFESEGNKNVIYACKQNDKTGAVIMLPIRVDVYEVTQDEFVSEIRRINQAYIDSK